MGTCSSVDRSKMPLVPSPSKHKAVKMVVATGSSLETDEFAGSKGETFFDSRMWLDSDCDDDFFSVNGDSTPSRCSTPNNQSGSLMNLSFGGSSSEPSPTGRKKLADLFQETMQPDPSHEKLEAEAKPASFQQTKTDRSLDKANSASGGATSPSRDLKSMGKKTDKVVQCCLPSYTFGERRQRARPVDCSAF